MLITDVKLTTGTYRQVRERRALLLFSRVVIPLGIWDLKLCSCNNDLCPATHFWVDRSDVLT